MDIEQVAEMEAEVEQTTPRGYSAYEVYVKNGGTLSEAEWLESLRGEQGPQGEPGAVKMQVVDTLPDTGETDTIYLLKKGIPSQQNLYDEYVYTETSGWEHIGDTSVDLTDYYTKEEINNKLDKFSYILDIKSNASTNSVFDGDKTNIWKTPLENAINEWLEKQEETYTDTNFRRKLALRFYCGNISSGNNTLLFTPDGSVSSSNMIYYCDYISPNSYTSSIPTYLSIGKRLVTITATMISGRISISKVVFSSNIATFYPGKYTLPIASADTLGGIKLGDGLSADENGVVSASGGIGDEQLVFAKVFDTDINSEYNKIFYSSGTTDNDVCNWFSDIFTKMKKGKTNPNQVGAIIILTFPGSAKNGRSIIFFSDGNMSYIKGFGMRYYGMYGYQLVCNSKFNDDGTVTVSKVSITENIRIEIDDPISNRHMANKKYVDDLPKSYTGYDATKTQVLKNVNGTLTWVNEE